MHIYRTGAYYSDARKKKNKNKYFIGNYFRLFRTLYYFLFFVCVWVIIIQLTRRPSWDEWELKYKPGWMRKSKIHEVLSVVEISVMTVYVIGWIKLVFKFIKNFITLKIFNNPKNF